MRFYWFIVFLSTFSFSVFSQNKSEKSVEELISLFEEKEILTRKKLFELYDYYSENDNDSFYVFANNLIETGLFYENWFYINFGKAVMTSFFNSKLKVDIATQFGQQSLEYFMSTSDYEMMSFVENQMGISYVISGKYEQARTWLLKSIESGKLTGDYKNNCVGLRNMGELYQRMEKLDSALYFSDLFINLVKDENKPISIAKTYNTKGNIYRDMGDMKNAVLFYEKALPPTTDNVSKILIGNVYNNLAIGYFEEDPMLAKEYFFKSFKVRKELNSLQYVADSYLNLGYWHQAMENLDSANYYFQTMLNYCLDNRYLEGQVEALDALSDYYATIGEIELSDECAEKSKKLSTWLDDEKTRILDEYIEKSKLLFDTEEKLRSALTLNKKTAVTMTKEGFKKYALFLVVFTSLLGGGNYLYTRRKGHRK